MPPITPSAVAERLPALGFYLTDSQAGQLALYLELLVQWNRRMNLVGPTGWHDILDRLVADSLHLGVFLERLQEGPLGAAPRSLDLGAGAGLPGIPLRVVWGKGDYTMVEAREKRATFLQVALARLGLAATRAVCCRVERLPAHLLPADLVLSRAFMPWAQVLELARPMVVPGGLVVVLANDPPPGAVPAGYAMVQVLEYATPAGRRWFWAFSRVPGQEP